MEAIIILAVLIALATSFMLLVALLPSPRRENLLGLVLTVMEAEMIWPTVLIAVLPVMLLLGTSTAQQYLLLFSYFAVTGFVLLWAGHQFEKPSHWIRDSLRSWRSDGAPDGDEELIPRFSALWRRRLGLVLLALAIPITAAVAVAEWVNT